MRALLGLFLALVCSIAVAHTDGIYNPTANSVGDTQGIDSNAAIGGGASPAYTFINSFTSSVAGDTVTVSAALGSNPTCVAVVGADIQGSTGTIVSVVVGGVTLTQDIFQSGNDPAGIYSGVLSSCTGSQNVVLTTTNGSFVVRDLYVWVLTNLTSNLVKQTSGYQRAASVTIPASPTISVTAGDFMFGAMQSSGNAFACSGSTQAPTAQRAASVNSNGADWTIAATNASFSLNCTGGTINASFAFATYH